MLPRFHAPDLASGATSVTLDRDETHHLVHVLRLTRGAPARVFDGRGGEWQGRVASCDKRGAVLDALEPVTPLPEPRVRVTLVAGLLRGAPMDLLVRDAVMLGVSAIVPAFSEHTVFPRRRDAAPVERWRRIVVTSCKQCGRAVVPPVEPPCPLPEALARPAGVKLMLTEPAAAAGSRDRIDDLAARARDAGALIAAGPEGGWSSGDLAIGATAGCLRWSLGTQVLRAEAMPLAALSVARYAWEA